MKEQFDNETSYCRSLGHYVPFKYCRIVSDQLPCRKIKDCWHEQLDIDLYLTETYSNSELDQIFAPPAEKISTILDLIQKAREKS